MEGSGGGGSTAPWRGSADEDQNRRQGSGGSGGSTPSTPAPPPAPPTPPTAGGGISVAPPPPPPLAPGGTLPAVRLSSEIGEYKGPPKAIQGAMMKDKKPFTYTPGGIDLSEIRSPRMAKRIQMNAAAEGVTSVPTASPHAPHNLPPAALAAMQPQMPISVFPQGGINPAANLHRTNKPNDFAPQQPGSPPCIPAQQTPNFQTIPPPPPMLQPDAHQQGQVQQMNRASPQQPAFRGPPTPTAQPAVSLADVMKQSIRLGSPQPRQPQQPPPQQPVPVQQPTPVPVQAQQPAPYHQQQPTRAQAVSQQIGPIYIPPPPIEQRPSVFGDRSQGPPPVTTTTVLLSQPQPASGNHSKSSSIDSDSDQASTPSTPQLNKAPTPWLTSQHHRKPNSPPTAGSATTPWGPPLGRTIPIAIARDQDELEESRVIPTPKFLQQTTAIIGDAINRSMQANNARGVHGQMQNNRGAGVAGNTAGPVPVAANGARVIPIQIQSSKVQASSGPGTPQTPQSASIPNNRRIGNTAYNSPRNQHAGEATSGMDRMSIGSEEGQPAPVQSKSFRVIQKITDDEEQRFQERQQRKSDLKIEGRDFMDTVKFQVDDGSSAQNTTEPRFRGGHIPSRAFQALRSHLPPSPGTQDAPPAFSTSKPGGPHVHNIQIRMAPSSPTPSYLPTQYQAPFEAGTHYAPGNGSTGPGPGFYQQIPEPKMYTGGNIPSRSFKILQTMTPNDVAALGESEAGVDQKMSFNSSSSNPQFLTVPSSSDPQSCNSNSNGSLSNGNGAESDVESDSEGYYYIDPENPETWDPYTYWYYYWYYAVNYWNGVPPENWEQYAEQYQQQPDFPVSIPSKAFKNLQKHFEDLNPDRACDKEDELHLNQITNKAEQKEPEPKLKETGSMDVIYEEDKETDDEEEDEQPEVRPEVKSESESDTAESNVGIVEEPDTPSSDWSEDDAFTLTEENGIKPSANVVIEEYLTDTDCESGSRDRLSTIDEMSENERSSIRSVSTLDLDSDSDSDSSSDQASSASVIENRSSETFGCSTTAKDETESSEDENPEIDGDIDDLDSAVTVRLPLRLSFSKSKSYRDIATVLVGCSEVQPSYPGRIKEEVIEKDDEDENVNEVSYTITLSRSGSNPKEERDAEAEPVSAPESQPAPEPEVTVSSDCTESTLEEETTVIEAEPINTEKCDEPPEESPIDFWGEIINNSAKMKKELQSPDHSEPEEEVKAPEPAKADNFWETPVTPVNFWEKQEVEPKKFNFWESHRNFEFTTDYEQESQNVWKEDPEVEDGQAELTEDDCPTLNTQYEDLSPTVETAPIFADNQEDDGADNHEDVEASANSKDDIAKIDEDYVPVNHKSDIYATPKSDPGTPSDESPEKGFAEVTISSDETSDESSSKSSGTITVKSDPPPDAENLEATEIDNTPEKAAEKATEKVAEKVHEKTNSKHSNSDPYKHNHNHDHTNGIHGIGSSCTCHASERSARAENLLWRIERFLKESLSLGSEDDSGVMTDTSRQMSDADTDEGEADNGCGVGTVKKPPNEDASTAAEKKALSYQRAKTHSRLFQLLQEECGRDGEEDEEILEDHLADIVVIDTVGAGTDSGALPPGPQPTESGRNCLLRTPALGFQAGSSSFDSSSPSGSSGLLSPTSREQVLVDIINQFQSRQNPAQPRRIPGFPSKVFKLLQQEFGEEFYDTFEFDGDVVQLPQVLLPCAQQEPVTECTVHKNADSTKNTIKSKDHHLGESSKLTESMKSKSKIQETKSTHTAKSTSTTNRSTNTAKSSSKDRSTKTGASDQLEVPLKGQKLIAARAKSTSPLSRDPRVPKTKKTRVKD